MAFVDRDLVLVVPEDVTVVILPCFGAPLRAVMVLLFLIAVIKAAPQVIMLATCVDEWMSY